MLHLPTAKRFVGKVVMITGSTDGIGLGIARRLAQEGADVMISSRKETNVDDAVNKLKSENLSVSGIVCHVGRADHRERLIKETVSTFGGIDILVNNAAFMPTRVSLMETTEELWEKVMAVNFTAPFFLTQNTIPHIAERGGGNILFVSSAGGYQTGGWIRNAYTVSKTSLFGLTKAFVPECWKRNIRVNCLAPGLITTDSNVELRTDPEILKLADVLIDMKRLGTIDEMTKAAAFLCSEDASYITGEILVAAGGFPTRL
ncbi:dehydrogenase/reductase SDR family member 4-like [Glandiceps talaboti]